MTPNSVFKLTLDHSNHSVNYGGIYPISFYRYHIVEKVIFIQNGSICEYARQY